MANKPPANFDWRSITPEDSPVTLPDVMATPSHLRLAIEDSYAGCDRRCEL